MTVYDPFTGRYPITEDWVGHIERGSGGGIDYAMATGTPLPAVDNGIIQNIPNYGTGGNTVRLHLTDNIYVEYMHLHAFAVPDLTTINKGDTLGYAGSTGNSTGPHLHIHAYHDATRIDFRALLVAEATTLKGNTDMRGWAVTKLVLADGNQGWFVISDKGLLGISEGVASELANVIYSDGPKEIGADTLKAIETLQENGK